MQLSEYQQISAEQDSSSCNYRTVSYLLSFEHSVAVLDQRTHTASLHTNANMSVFLLLEI